MSAPDVNVADHIDQINNLLHPPAKEINPEPLSSLELLAEKLVSLKDKRTSLNNEIKELEHQLILETGFKTEGVANFNLPNYKISTTGKIDRKITDLQSLTALVSGLVVTKHSLDMKEFNALARTNPSLMQRVLLCIESKVARTTVSITKIEG